MPEPVSNPSANRGSPLVECEPVPVSPEPESSADFDCFEAEPEPGVKALVERHSAPVRTELIRLDPVDADVPYFEIVRSCMPKAIGVVVSVEEGGPLSVFRSSWEFSACVAQQINAARLEAGLRAAVLDCEDRGGIPTGVLFDELQCLGPGMFR